MACIRTREVAVSQVITDELRQELIFSSEAWCAIDKAH